MKNIIEKIKEELEYIDWGSVILMAILVICILCVIALVVILILGLCGIIPMGHTSNSGMDNFIIQYNTQQVIRNTLNH